MQRVFVLLLLLGICSVSHSATVEFAWSHSFFGDGISNTKTIPFGRLDGDNSGFVGATANAVPRRYINSEGNLECHILLRYQNGIISTTGDIYNPANGDTCPLLSGAVPIRSVEAFGTDICIGGDFTNLGGVNNLSYFACSSPTLGWYQPAGIGNGPNGPVYSVEKGVNGSQLFVGGSFTSANSNSARHIVKTDGISWERLLTDSMGTSDGVSFTVQTIFPTNNFLYVGMGKSVLSWNPSVPEWLTRGTANGSNVTDIAFNGSVIAVAAPQTTLFSGDSAGSISDFDSGSEMWSETGSSNGIDIDFGQLSIGLGPTYASGNFSSIDPNAKGLAFLGTSDWQAAPNAQQLGDLNTTPITEMQQGFGEFCLLNQGSVPSDSQIYWNRLVCYDGSEWFGPHNAPSYGGNGGVGDFAKFQGQIVYAGDFDYIGDQRSRFVARLGVDDRWEAISQLSWSGGGTDYVRYLQEYNGDLYATGLFDTANGMTANAIAKWNGTQWTPAVPGFFATQNSPMTVWDNRLVVAGFYNGLNSVIAWDGNTIEKLDGAFGMNHFEVYQGDLIADGSSGVIRYNNNGTWSEIISNVPNINVLKAVGSNLFIGGSFTGVCNGGLFVNANNIMRWDGSQCYPLGEGVVDGSSSFDSVQDIGVMDGDLIVMGRFDHSGLKELKNLAYWDGTSWSAIGQGLVDHTGNGHLFVDGNDLYVSGGFSQAGDVLVGGFAKSTLVFKALFANGFE
ncbi:MAG: hypothetical protein ACWA5R_09565 [bacterium]